MHLQWEFHNRFRFFIGIILTAFYPQRPNQIEARLFRCNQHCNLFKCSYGFKGAFHFQFKGILEVV
jgi:hypothetical protein